MPTPLYGKNAFIQILKDEDYLLFGCATDLTFSMKTEVVNVATVGTGHWDDWVGDSNGYTIDLRGLTYAPDEAGFYTSWDLLEAQKQMVHVEYLIVFENAESEVLMNIYGTALVTDGNLQAGVEFVNSGFSLIGKGEPTIGIQPTCAAEIGGDEGGNYTVDQDVLAYHKYHVAILELISGGSVPSYDYRIDGGAMQTALSTGWHFSVADRPNAGIGNHVLEIWPVCENGARGIKTIYPFSTSPL